MLTHQRHTCIVWFWFLEDWKFPTLFFFLPPLPTTKAIIFWVEALCIGGVYGLHCQGYQMKWGGRKTCEPEVPLHMVRMGPGSPLLKVELKSC